ncbi:MAG: hypothetical protein AAGJ10_16045 [Bacteroidota bacterium]
MEVSTPHIPLGISLGDGLKILTSVSPNVEKLEGANEDFYKVASDEWECGIYTNGQTVHSTWYNDALGRESEAGINQKVELYLTRYGAIEGWQEGLNNGWIQFFSNRKAGIGMAYGIQNDVIRFNLARS